MTFFVYQPNYAPWLLQRDETNIKYCTIYQHILLSSGSENISVNDFNERQKIMQ